MQLHSISLAHSQRRISVKFSFYIASMRLRDRQQIPFNITSHIETDHGTVKGPVDVSPVSPRAAGSAEEAASSPPLAPDDELPVPLLVLQVAVAYAVLGSPTPERDPNLLLEAGKNNYG